MAATPTLYLLHGALGAAAQFSSLQSALEKNFNCKALNFYGHGNAAAVHKTFRIELFAEQLHQELQKETEPVHVFGYSMGGFVACYCAHQFPERIKRIFTLGTKWEWTAETVSREVKMLDANTIQQKVPAFATQLAKRHSALSWEVVLQRTAEMMRYLSMQKIFGTAEAAGLQLPVCYAIGDRDKMVSKEETHAMYSANKLAQYCVLPNTPHPIEQVNDGLLVSILNHFFSTE